MILRWSHACNSIPKLRRAMRLNSTAIELDVGLNPHKKTAVVHHAATSASTLTIDEWVDEFELLCTSSSTVRVLKIDFKSNKAIDSVTTRLSSLRDVEIWLNGDVCRGPGGDDVVASGPLDGDEFIRKCSSAMPDAVLSLGWTTDVPMGRDLAYTKQHVEDMVNLLRRNNIHTKITFSIRACYFRASYVDLNRRAFLQTLLKQEEDEEIRNLLAVAIAEDKIGEYELMSRQEDSLNDLVRAFPSATITLWCWYEGVPQDDVEYARRLLGPRRLIEDLPHRMTWFG